jgi:hypothetical protein
MIAVSTVSRSAMTSQFSLSQKGVFNDESIAFTIGRLIVSRIVLSSAGRLMVVIQWLQPSGYIELFPGWNSC